MEAVPPQDNTFDFTRLTRQLELNAEVLMERISRHAHDENEKLSLEIVDLKFKVLCLEAIVESLMPKGD